MDSVIEYYVDKIVMIFIEDFKCGIGVFGLKINNCIFCSRKYKKIKDI